MQNRFLPGVPVTLVEAALQKAGGNELEGKFDNPRSSAALAVNGFGWFMERPDLLPRLPGLDDLSLIDAQVTVERQMRFPWSGGRHPWLDAAIETASHIIGVESKRYEPFRSAKPAKLSNKYSEHRWGEGMEAWNSVRDALRANPRLYRHLDATQLVKHAYGLATEGEARSRFFTISTRSHAMPLGRKYSRFIKQRSRISHSAPSARRCGLQRAIGGSGSRVFKGRRRPTANPCWSVFSLKPFHRFVGHSCQR